MTFALYYMLMSNIFGFCKRAFFVGITFVERVYVLVRGAYNEDVKDSETTLMPLHLIYYTQQASQH